MLARLLKLLVVLAEVHEHEGDVVLAVPVGLALVRYLLRDLVQGNLLLPLLVDHLSHLLLRVYHQQPVRGQYQDVVVRVDLVRVRFRLRDQERLVL